MITDKKPYFLSDPEWYYYDEEAGSFKLTDKAPQKAIDSYEEFYTESNIIYPE